MIKQQKKPFLSGKEIKTSLLLIFVCPLAGLIGEALVSLTGKALSIPTNMHIGGIVGILTGFTVTCFYCVNKKEKTKQEKKLKSKIKARKVKKPWFTEKEKEVLMWLFVIATLPLLVWVAINSPYEFIARVLSVVIAQQFIFRYHSRKQALDKPDSSPDIDLDPDLIPVKPKPFNPPPFQGAVERELVETYSSSSKTERNYSDIHRYLN